MNGVDFTPAANQDSSHTTLIIAHRGDSRRAPENTLPAFSSALESGADMVELDYVHSLDGVPVVFHDKYLDRKTNAEQVFKRGSIRVDSIELSELRKLDAGSWFNKRFAETTIPTLAEALDVIQERSSTVIERKGGDPRTCVELLKEKRLIDSVVVQAFDWDYLAGCHSLAPELTLAALGEGTLTDEKLEQIENMGAKIVGWNYKNIGTAQIESIHRRGLKVWVYTVNDQGRAKHLSKAGIDGMITDVPSELVLAINHEDR